MHGVAVVPGAHRSVHLRADVPEPRTAEGEVLVRVLETGVCGTDLEINEGVFGEAPPGSPYLVIGHENLGIVENAPPGSPVAPGDLVVPSNRRECRGPCAPCAAARSDLCLTGEYRERGIKGLHGFMSERYAESPRYLVKVPAHLRGCAVLLEPLSVVEKGLEQAFRVQERLPWTPRSTLVLGAGPIGILAAATLRMRGFEVTVAALEPEGSFRDAVLREAGIRYVSTASIPPEALADHLEPADLVFEATGAPRIVLPAMRLLAPNGVCILASVTSGPGIEADVAGWNREMMLGNRAAFGTVNSARRHFEAAVRHLAIAEQRRPGWMSRLVTRRVPPSEAAQALERTPDDVKTVVTFD
jgi:threonine dehydrogenase-like Zn-dependent dehydrogenase